MKLQMQTLAAGALAFITATACAAVADTRQLAASAGLDASAGSEASLDEIARAKFNNDTRQGDRLVVVVIAGDAGSVARGQLAASSGVSTTDAAASSLNELAVAKFNHDTRRDDWMTVAQPEPTVYAVVSMDGTPEVGSRTVREIYRAEAIREAAGE